MTAKFMVQVSIDGGETWGDCGEPTTKEEAVAIKRDIDHNSDGCEISARVKTLD